MQSLINVMEIESRRFKRSTDELFSFILLCFVVLSPMLALSFTYIWKADEIRGAYNYLTEDVRIKSKILDKWEGKFTLLDDWGNKVSVPVDKDLYRNHNLGEEIAVVVKRSKLMSSAEKECLPGRGCLRLAQLSALLLPLGIYIISAVYYEILERE